MRALATFLAMLVVFLLIDLLWIQLVVYQAYEKVVGYLIAPKPRVAAASAFYLLYVSGLYLLAVRPALRERSPRRALFNGAALGGFAYGTYALTNYAMFAPWTWHLVWTDMLWGVVLSSGVSLLGFWIGRKFNAIL